mmetsp:Transcript_27650/g.45732  ORF Transcript_27650/g.45732 Transcript_27650/m.45732 type:complete len:120 (-) Transcript_27650:128-487(-)|eukprot:CAMPEP_0178756408 /NCGR_PEP_ID=MMETSP0744-20121128/13257_1 /TAXON_ID=913974 /ORGANISM="Nitzschia punctata, Strain CCMP561" /LENGTH=119 /DNA_ID=CAMNT_0020410545 /DNA_START=158 /DNA_END=517 /DNA_ORIENTATION=+
MSGYNPPPEQQQQNGSNESGGTESLMTMAIQQQDSMIDELAVGVSRLRDQSSAIGDEARLHTSLLNDTEANLDAAHQGLGDETRRAARLRTDADGLWKLQLIVAGLFILFVFQFVLGSM